MKLVKVIPLSAMSLCQTYYGSGNNNNNHNSGHREKILSLRPEMLTLMLGLCGVAVSNGSIDDTDDCGCNVLVWDRTSGLISAALKERFDGTKGEKNKKSSFSITLDMAQSNWPWFMEVMYGKGSWQSINQADKSNRNKKASDAGGNENVNGDAVSVSGDTDVSETVMADTVTNDVPSNNSVMSSSDLAQQSTNVYSQLLRYSSLIITLSSHLGNMSILHDAMLTMMPSANLLIYCPWREPLIPIYSWLRSNYSLSTPLTRTPYDSDAKNTHSNVFAMVNVRLLDIWSRQYQAISGRIHPVMSMSGQDGYLLVATKVSLQ